jgi:hypothetical protein
MPRRDEATLVLHGLDVDGRGVRADVFARKLQTFIAGLREADKFVNGRISFGYMIAGLNTDSSATATIRQKQRSRYRPGHSGIAAYEDAASAIYNGDRRVLRYPDRLIAQIRRLGDGALRTFSHGEIAFADEVIRVDDFLLRQSDAVREVLINARQTTADRHYRGVAVGRFDGELKEIDSRGTMLRGKLILSAGGAEIDCVMNKDKVPDAREGFDKRVVVIGVAHYDGENQLPARIDVATINALSNHGNLIRWRGAFEGPGDEDAVEDWEEDA